MATPTPLSVDHLGTPVTFDEFAQQVYADPVVDHQGDLYSGCEGTSFCGGHGPTGKPHRSHNEQLGD